MTHPSEDDFKDTDDHEDPKPVQVDRVEVALKALERLWDENNLTRAYEERRADLDYIKAVITDR